MSSNLQPNHIHLGRPSWVDGEIFARGAAMGKLHAAEPWDFTRHILFEFQNSDIDAEHPEWMTNWFAGVALLRTIGHVLRNVDRTRDTVYQNAIDAFWEDIKSNRSTHWIFFDFIELERNNILKEFSFGATLPMSTEDSLVLVYSHHDGWDATQLFREAVYWWRAQLEHLAHQIENSS